MARRQASNRLTWATGNERQDETSQKILAGGRKGGGLAVKQHNEWVREKTAEGDLEGGLAGGQSGTSIFDPVLCELVYRWFCPPEGIVLDPFAGGSVRGIVASKLGRKYVGVDLSARQLEANDEQADGICRPGEPHPLWLPGDSTEIDKVLGKNAPEVDMVFSCPPYADLEVYSDDPRDLSNMDYKDFREKLALIVRLSCLRMKRDRFACFVVGDVRDAKGFYYGLPGDTIAAFRSAGLELYNQAILVTAAGSLPVRVRRQFESARKLGSTHQYCYIFIKGDPKLATKAIGPVECGDLSEAALPGESENQSTAQSAGGIGGKV